MTDEELDITYGTVVYRDGERIVRVKRDDGGLNIVVHRVEDGHERLPRGYWLGSNYLLAEN